MDWFKGYFFDSEDRGVVAQVKFGHCVMALLTLAFLAFAVGSAIVYGVRLPW